VRAFEVGDYVFTHTQYDFFGPKVGFDIFHFEDDLIVEHWDKLQPIVSETALGRPQLDGPTEIKDLDKTDENKAIIKSFVDDVLMGTHPEKITDYISTTQYNQHNPMVKDGLAELGEAIESLNEAGMPKWLKRFRPVASGKKTTANSNEYNDCYKGYPCGWPFCIYLNITSNRGQRLFPDCSRK